MPVLSQQTKDTVGKGSLAQEWEWQTAGSKWREDRGELLAVLTCLYLVLTHSRKCPSLFITNDRFQLKRQWASYFPGTMTKFLWKLFKGREICFSPCSRRVSEHPGRKSVAGPTSSHHNSCPEDSIDVCTSWPLLPPFMPSRSLSPYGAATHNYTVLVRSTPHRHTQSAWSLLDSSQSNQVDKIKYDI